MIEEVEETRKELPGQLREVLMIDPNISLSKKLITKSYRKLCLKMHPDKVSI